MNKKQKPISPIKPVEPIYRRLTNCDHVVKVSKTIVQCIKCNKTFLVYNEPDEKEDAPIYQDKPLYNNMSFRRNY